MDFRRAGSGSVSVLAVIVLLVLTTTHAESQATNGVPVWVNTPQGWVHVVTDGRMAGQKIRVWSGGRGFWIPVDAVYIERQPTGFGGDTPGVSILRGLLEGQQSARANKREAMLQCLRIVREASRLRSLSPAEKRRLLESCLDGG